MSEYEIAGHCAMTPNQRVNRTRKERALARCL
jgi:hypothetical protein